LSKEPNEYNTLDALVYEEQIANISEVDKVYNSFHKHPKDDTSITNSLPKFVHSFWSYHYYKR